MTDENGAASRESAAPPNDQAAQPVENKATDLAALLHGLGYSDSERLSLCHALPGDPGSFTGTVLTPAKVDAEVDRWNDSADVWFSVNPVDPPAGYRGRGGVAHVSRWAAIYADLDVKPGGLPDVGVARLVTAGVTGILGVQTMAVIESGHGLQPVWALDPEDEATDLDDDERRAVAVALLRRFGRLVQRVAEGFDGAVDPVFDLARVLRVPGTMNRKQEPVPVRVKLRDPVPLSVDRLAEVLDEYGVPEYSEDRELLGEIVSDPHGWGWAERPCPYARTMIDGWSTDRAPARHPWLVGQATRLAAAHRYGCLTEAEHQRGVQALTDGMHHLCSTQTPVREVAPGEIRGALSWGATRVARMQDGDRLGSELGHHDHHHDDPLDGIVADGSEDGASGKTRADPATPATRGDSTQAAEQACSGCRACHGSAGGVPQGAGIADAVLDFLTGYVAFPTEHAAVAAALWVLHTHALDGFDTTPRLAALSPEPASGKTRLLEVVGMLAANALHTTNSSVAAIFRKIEMDRPTLLFDEVDAIFGRYGKDEDNESLRGLLNSGHAKGTPVFRCVTEGKTIVVKDFDVFAPVALAGLGNLPETLMTRSVVIRMRKRRPTERLEPYRRRRVEPEGHRLRAHLAAWGASVVDSLADAWPDMPAGVEDRAADCWEPLLAVADALGGRWPQVARDACESLIKATATDAAPSLRVRLLRDLHLVFGDRLAMWTSDILTELHALEESPWRSLGGEPLDPLRLAGLLREHGIRSQDIRLPDGVRKGYRRSDLWDAWERYCPDLLEATPRNPATGATPATSQLNGPTSVAAPIQQALPEPLHHEENR